MSILITACNILTGVALGYAGYSIGKHEGKRKTLDELRADLDKTAEEWMRRGDAGEVVRYVELPGIQAVRRMLGFSPPVPSDAERLRVL